MLGATLNSAADWATVVLGVVAAGGAIGAALLFSFRIWRQLQLLEEKSDRVETQVTPNGGDSETSADRLLRVEEHLKQHIENDENVQQQILERLDAIPPRRARAAKKT